MDTNERKRREMTSQIMSELLGWLSTGQSFFALEHTCSVSRKAAKEKAAMKMKSSVNRRKAFFVKNFCMAVV